MIPKLEVFLDSDNVVLIFCIIISESFQNLDFNQTLIVKPFLVPDNFHGDVLLLFVVKALEAVAKGPFS